MDIGVFVVFLVFLFSLVHNFQRVNCLTGEDSDWSERNPCTKAELGNKYNGSVSIGNEDIYCFNYSAHVNYNATVRVTVSSNNTNSVERPLLVVSRQQRGVLSWSVPLITEDSHVFYTVSRNLCPSFFFTPGEPGSPSNEFFIDISTSSLSEVYYNFKAELVHPFVIGVNQDVKAIVSPSQPEYFLFKFPAGLETVIVKAESDSEVCAILSIQGTKCPVFDLARNVEFTGIFQTMTKKAGITFKKKDFVHDQAFIVLVVKPDDAECRVGKRSRNPSLPPESEKHPRIMEDMSVSLSASKMLRLRIEKTIGETEYITAIVVPVVFFGMFYVLTVVVIGCYWCRQRKSERSSLWSTLLASDPEYHRDIRQSSPSLRPLKVSEIDADSHRYGSTSQDSDGETHTPHKDVHQAVNEGGRRSIAHLPFSTTTSSTTSSQTDGTHQSDDDEQFDLLEDIEKEKDIYRLKPDVVLTDLSKKTTKKLKKKYRLYHWNLATIAVFYFLPAIQLVFTYLKVMTASGDQDLCYYNFFCAQPALGFMSFNNVYSNIGYFMLGVLFFLLVLRRDKMHRNAVLQCREVERYFGIPQHFELLYALGLSLIMEGVMSACYHVCPDYSNFQFDTSFMYIITCLGIVRLYQIRHPDIAANAHYVYACLAAIILAAVVGVVYNSPTFWGIFVTCYVLGSLYLSSHLYYMGRLKLDGSIFTRFLMFVRYDLCKWPLYKDRMILLVIGNTINWSFAVYGITSQPTDFATYLLSILIVNGLLYAAFYIAMKYRNKERMLPLPSFCFILTLIFWCMALVFYLRRHSTWQKSPARSREGNQDCILLGFYDDHDIWHFLSAISMFFSFLSLLTIDDDLEWTPRHKIAVF